MCWRWSPGGAAAVVWLALGVGLLAAPVRSTAAAPYSRSDPVDFAWLPAPASFVDARDERQYLRVAPLLVQSCVRVSGDERRKRGEDYLSNLLARVTLLRMLDSRSGATAVRAAMDGYRTSSTALPRRMLDPGHVLRSCLTALAPDWNRSVSSAARAEPGWDQVVRELAALPELTGRPGTDGVLACRDEDTGNDDIAQALLLRIWLLALPHLRAAPVEGTSTTRLEQHISRVVWLQGGRSDLDDTVCAIVPETENHRLLIASTRFLHNESLPALPPADFLRLCSAFSGRGGDYCHYITSLNADNATNGVGAWLRSRLAGWLEHDFLEYNARPYTRYQLIALLNLYDFARDEDIRSAARAVIDLLMSKMAAESMNGLRTAPFRRREDHASDALFAGDTLAPMSQVWLGNLESGARPSGGFVAEMALAASTTYHPPDVLADVMIDRGRHDYLQSFDGQGQFETAAGSPDYTIAGGGVSTPCPYPAPEPLAPLCIGSGNDRGSVQPVVFLPRRSHDRGGRRSAYDPTYATVLHANGMGSTCIGPDVACGSHFTGPPPGRDDPACARHAHVGGDDIAAWRVDSDCAADPAYRDDCFFLYERSRPARLLRPVLTYLVAHECVPGGALQRDRLFDSFVTYLTSGPGAPVEQGHIERSCIGSGKRPGGVSNPACTVLRVRLPTRAGAVRPGRTVTFSGFTDLYGVSTNPRRPGVAAGTLAHLAPHDRLVLEDRGADERVYERLQGAPLDIDAPHHLTWSARLARSGAVAGKVSHLSHPDLLRSLTLSALDETAEGRRHAAPVVLATKRFRPRNAVVAAGQRTTVGGTVANLARDHTYALTVCATWWRFWTSADYRSLALGAPVEQGTDDTCETDLVRAPSIVEPLRP